MLSKKWLGQVAIAVVKHIFLSVCIQEDVCSKANWTRSAQAYCPPSTNAACVGHPSCSVIG